MKIKAPNSSRLASSFRLKVALLLGLGLFIPGLPAFSQVSFEPAMIIPLEGGGIPEVGDFNGDSIPDIAAGYSGGYGGVSSKFAIFLGTGNGNFGSPTVYNPGIACWSFTTAFDVADFNNDGYLDVVKTYGGSQGGCFG
ncbi:MAG: FG-GAP repeat domain-containing protein, partial [Candidatus Neomarinimicrobiota bacterium]